MEAKTSLDLLAAVALELVAQANQQGIRARVIGSIGIHLHCEAAAMAMSRAGRTGKDIDLVVAGRDRNRLRDLLESNGYEIDRDLLVAMEGSRYSFAHPETGVGLDVFFDRMEFCHTIDLSRRLEAHTHTASIEDLLLSKLQVHEMTANDLSDAITILATHGVGAGGGGAEEIDARYVAGLLGKDWGFHHTVDLNLAALEGALAPAAGLREEQVERAADGIAVLRTAIDDEKKSRGWRMRAKVGERMQWWEDVDDDLEAY